LNKNLLPKYIRHIEINIVLCIIIKMLLSLAV